LAGHRKTCLASSNKNTAPPTADRRDEAAEWHGRTLIDSYAWIRDPNWQQVMREPESLRQDIRDHLEAENAYTEAALAPIARLREELTAEMKARIKEDDSSVPAPDGKWAYYRRFVTGGQYPVLCRKPRDAVDAECEQILLDGNAEARGQSFFAIGGAAHTTDHRRFAYAEDLNGSEYCTIRFKDLESGALLDDQLADARGDMAWADDGQILFYTVLDENHRPALIKRHRLGSPADQDDVIHEELDPGFVLGIDRTESGRFIVISAHDHADTTEVRLIDASDPDAAPRLIAERRTGVTYDVSDHGDRLVIRTNAGGAVDFKIAAAPLANPAPKNWRDVVPHRPGCLIRSMILFQDYLVRLERENALPRIVVR